MSHFTISRAVSALLVVSAIVVPAANARPIDAPGASVPLTSQTQGYSTPASPVESTSGGANTDTGGFDWGDAAIGAAGALIVLSMGAAGVATIRRSRGHRHRVLTS
jgi:hypothetical protein